MYSFIFPGPFPIEWIYSHSINGFVFAETNQFLDTQIHLRQQVNGFPLSISFTMDRPGSIESSNGIVHRFNIAPIEYFVPKRLHHHRVVVFVPHA